MPTKTFFNLHEDKQNTLIEAAKEEFSKELLANASINMIIKKARISRGSFYMYFKDKEDLYFYLIDIYKGQLDNLILTTLKECNGDILITASKLFDNLSKMIIKGNATEFVRKIILNMNYLMENKLISRKRPINEESQIIKLLDRSKFNINNEEEFFSLLHIVIEIFGHNLIELVNDPDKFNEITREFERQLNILKIGVYRGDKV